MGAVRSRRAVNGVATLKMVLWGDPWHHFALVHKPSGYAGSPAASRPLIPRAIAAL